MGQPKGRIGLAPARPQFLRARAKRLPATPRPAHRWTAATAAMNRMSDSGTSPCATPNVTSRRNGRCDVFQLPNAA